MANLVPRDSGTQLRAMFDRMVGGNPNRYMSYDAARKHARTTGDVLRSGGESVVVGAVLGIVNASRADGLDVRTSLTNKAGLPIDGAAALAFGVAAIASAQEDYSKDFVNASAAAAAIFAFRKASDMVTEMNLKKSGATPGGGALIPGKISKASFGGERRSYGNGFVGSRLNNASMGEDPIVVAGQRL